ncbi:hypothetical protein K3495_g587 [Podosphaera aphanis]|nr:hypothetical protein K3495_g587 [Podosphaera aphanis]
MARSTAAKYTPKNAKSLAVSAASTIIVLRQSTAANHSDVAIVPELTPLRTALLKSPEEARFAMLTHISRPVRHKSSSIEPPNLSASDRQESELEWTEVRNPNKRPKRRPSRLEVAARQMNPISFPTITAPVIKFSAPSPFTLALAASNKLNSPSLPAAPAPATQGSIPTSTPEAPSSPDL